METKTTQENSEAGAGLGAATGYSALVAKLESELQEIADAKEHAGATQEWKRYDRLCGAQDTLLGLRLWMRRNPPVAEITLKGNTPEELWSSLLDLLTYACECKQKQDNHWPHMVSTDAGKITMRHNEGFN